MAVDAKTFSYCKKNNIDINVQRAPPDIEFEGDRCDVDSILGEL